MLSCACMGVGGRRDDPLLFFAGALLEAVTESAGVVWISGNDVVVRFSGHDAGCAGDVAGTLFACVILFCGVCGGGVGRLLLLVCPGEV